MEFGGDITTKWDFVIWKENYTKVLYTGRSTANNLGTHSLFISNTIILSVVLINKTLG